MANPYANDVSRQYIAAQMAALCKKLQFLFGAGTLGVTRVASWVTNNNTLGDYFGSPELFEPTTLKKNGATCTDANSLNSLHF